jgi:hypothetical protein
MIGTDLRRKRSESGISLILTVSVIGLALIVTAGAFLAAASVGRHAARLATAKVDIETREETLMRAVLQQTATGILPGTNGVSGSAQSWTDSSGATGIIPNAANVVRATTYVDPSEVAELLPSGVIPANMADTGGTALGIFQGYNVSGYSSTATPFGGTSGLTNVVSSYNATVQPPLMNWSGNTTLSAANALTTPQEFFLGSLYTGLSSAVTKLSSTNRWGRITYPNIRFGYNRPGDPNFIARRVWWRIPVLYQTTQQTLEDQPGLLPTQDQPGGPRYPSTPPSGANYILSVYEIPSQLPISGNANLQIGQNTDGTAWGSWVQLSGSNGTAGSTGPNCSIYGNQIQLAGGTYNSVSSRQQTNITKSATIGGETFADSSYDNLGVREQRDLTRSTSLTGTAQIGAAPVSVAGNDGKALLVPVMPGNNFYMAAAGTPTHWDLYARPYYRCRIRLLISGTNSTLIYNPNSNPQINTASNTGAITVKVILLPDTSNRPDQILGVPDSSGTTTTYTQTSYAAGGLPSYMVYTSTGTGTSADRNVLLINIGAMVTALGSPAQLYSIYIGSNPTTEPASPATTSDPGIAITGTKDLSKFSSGLSIVTNQTLYLLDFFNQGTTQPPASIYAPDIRYGVSGVNPSAVGLTGQIALDPTPTQAPSPTPTPGGPLNFVDGANHLVSPSAANNTFSLSEIIDPTQVPPITQLTLLFTIEKERTN